MNREVRGRITFSEGQQRARDLMSGPARNCLLFGGARSGKTVLFIRGLVMRGLKAPGSKHAVWRYKFNHVKGSILMGTLPKVMQLCFPGVEYRRNLQDGYVTLPTGSEIWCGGLDEQERADKVLGQEYSTVYLNEASQIPYSSALIATTRLAEVSKCQDGSQLMQRSWADCNPPDKSHWTNLLYRLKIDPIKKTPLANPEAYVSARLNPVDNAKNLDPEFLKSLENLPEKQRKRFFDGEYGDDSENAIFQRSWVQLYPWNKPFPYFQFIIQSYDTAFTEKTSNHPTACSVWGVFKIGVVDGRDRYGALLLDCWSEHLKYPDLRDKAREEYERPYPNKDGRRPDLVLIEEKATGMPLVHDLQRARVPARGYNPGNADKVTRAHAVSQLVKDGLLWVPEATEPHLRGEPDPFCVDLMDQLCSFSAASLKAVEALKNVEDTTHHFDFVDTISQTFAYLRDTGMLTVDKPLEEIPEDDGPRVNPYSV